MPSLDEGKGNNGEDVLGTKLDCVEAFEEDEKRRGSVELRLRGVEALVTVPRLPIAMGASSASLTPVRLVVLPLFDPAPKLPPNEPLLRPRFLPFPSNSAPYDSTNGGGGASELELDERLRDMDELAKNPVTDPKREDGADPGVAGRRPIADSVPGRGSPGSWTGVALETEGGPVVRSGATSDEAELERLKRVVTAARVTDSLRAVPGCASGTSKPSPTGGRCGSAVQALAGVRRRGGESAGKLSVRGGEPGGMLPYAHERRCERSREGRLGKAIGAGGSGTVPPFSSSRSELRRRENEKLPLRENSPGFLCCSAMEGMGEGARFVAQKGTGGSRAAFAGAGPVSRSLPSNATDSRVGVSTVAGVEGWKEDEVKVGEGTAEDVEAMTGDDVKLLARRRKDLTLSDVEFRRSRRTSTLSPGAASSSPTASRISCCRISSRLRSSSCASSQSNPPWPFPILSAGESGCSSRARGGSSVASWGALRRVLASSDGGETGSESVVCAGRRWPADVSAVCTAQGARTGAGERR